MQDQLQISEQCYGLVIFAQQLHCRLREVELYVGCEQVIFKRDVILSKRFGHLWS